MRIVNTGQENALPVTNIGSHSLNGMRIPTASIGGAIRMLPWLTALHRPAPSIWQFGPQFIDDFEGFLEWTIYPATIVAGQDANIVLKATDHASQVSHRVTLMSACRSLM
jgi:hypothetical protein